MFLRILDILLPNAKAWNLTANKQLRQFFEGLVNALGDDTKTFYDEIWSDIDPQKTRELDAWDAQWALLKSNLTEQERRDRLDATWKALGGQDPRYIEDTLRAAGFDVYIHEWWEPASNPPVPRNPLLYLDDGTGGTPWTMYDGGVDAQDGDSISQDGGTNTPSGYPLVNKVLESAISLIGDGSPEMMDGGLESQDGDAVIVYSFKQYVIPVDPTKYPYFLYIGGQNFPDQAFIPTARKDEFEDLCLKICPTEQWLGILVTYT